MTGQLNVRFLTSTCDTKYASSPIVPKLQDDIMYGSVLIMLQTFTLTDKEY
jgi:hypothetical protein